ncbi:MAG: InlB B-repeat-containing protein [Salinivirgaceae bacterium]|nr:InlB B-repeat-containing protein [Salinivirgaceae bacterium]
MKNILLKAFMAVCLTAMTFAAIAQNSFNYQAVIRDGGKVLENKSVSLRLSVISDDSVYYQEKHAVTTNAYGNVNVSVGEGETLRGNFNAIPWETMQVMMQVEVSTDGSDNYTNMGSMQIMPVPYALYAAHTSVIQPTVATEDPIFEVRDSEGNLMFAVYETGVKVFVDQEGSKAAKSKFAVAGLSEEKGEQSLLTINADGTTVYVDDNSKAAKSKFAVAGQSADKTNYNLLTIDGSGSTVYVGGEGKAAKSKFAVSGYSANKAAENNYSIDGDGSTVYVDFTDNSKGSADVLSIDGSQATFYVDDTKEGKAAKSSFAVAGRSAGKSVDTAFIIDGSGTLIYIDDIGGSDKGDVSRFIVAGLTANNSGNYNDKFFTINRDSTRIYINDEPVVADTTGTGTTPVVTPSFASAFAIVGLTQKTELLTVNKDSTTIKVDTYVAEEVQSTTGVVAKVVDDTKPDKVYSTGTICASLYYSDGGYSDNYETTTTYAYYHSENGEYLYLKLNVGEYITEYHNYWFCNGKIHEQVYNNGYGYGGYGGYGGYYSYYGYYGYEQQSYVGELLEPREWDGKSLLLLMERTLRDSGYAVMPNDGTNYFYLKDEPENYIVSSENNIVTGLKGENSYKIIHENLGTFSCILDSILHLDYYDISDFDWGNLNEKQYGYALFGDDVITDNIIAKESEAANTEFRNEAEAYRYRYDLYRYGLSDFENMFASFDKGFKVQVESDANGKVEVYDVQENYTFGQTVTIAAIPDDDYMFASWSDGSTQNPRAITVVSDTILKASFDRAAFYVKEGGDDNAAGTVNAPLATINGAVQKITEYAESIDNSYYKTFIIKVDGTLYGAQNIGAENDAAFKNYEIGQLVLEGAHTLVAGQNPTDVLDGQFNEDNMNHTLYINSRADVTIRNLKITGGYSSSGGGIYTGNYSTVTLDDGTLITGNIASNEGGGIYNAYTLTVKPGATITSNRAKIGGGIFDCFLSSSSTTTIKGGTIVENTADSLSVSNDVFSYKGLTIGGDANVGDVLLENNGSYTNSGIKIISNLTNSDLRVSISGDDLFAKYFNEENEIISIENGVTMPIDEILSKFSFQKLWKVSPDDRKLRCLVEFEGDGADIGTMPPVQEFAKGEHETVEEPVIEPERDGYKFLGWYTSANGGETLSEAPFDFDTEFNFGGKENGSIIKGFKLYAKWLKAITYYVKPDGGDNSNNGLSEQDAFATFDYALQQIDQLNKPDSVFRIMIVGSIGALELSSALNGKANTIILQGYDEYAVIDGGFTKSNQGSALTISTTVPVTISKLKITGGYAASGGGVYIHTGNASTYVTIGSGTLITENTAEGHDGQAGGGGIFSSDGTLRVFGGEISNNTNTDGTGGGILVYNGNVNIMGGKITENQAASGGGVYVFQYGNVTIGGNAQITSNSANMGGGICFGSFLMNNVVVGGNAAISGNQATTGNGIYAGDSKLLLKDNVTIAAGNDVYLAIPDGYDNIATIAVDGTLSDDNVVITITPEQYNIGEPVLSLVDGAATTIAAEYFKFTLSDSSYALGYDGKVRDGVAVDGKVYAKYPITTAAEYTELFDVMNNSKINTAGMLISIESEEDTLTLENFKPYDPGSIAFKGVFDGNGHTLKIDSICKGRFMVICWQNDGIIQNVKVIKQEEVVCGQENRYPDGFSGGICHQNFGIIRNCWSDVSADVTFVYPIGGICTHNYAGGVIENCLNTGNITGHWGKDLPWRGEYGVVGGICGANYGTVRNSVNYGTISMATTYNVSGVGLNGIPGAICGALYDGASSCVNCYWRQNCVENTNNSNNMVYNDSRMRNGSATGCGFFTSNTNGTLTAGTEATCGSAQELNEKKDLLPALNSYVQVKNAISVLNGESSVLKSWKVEEGSHAAVLDFGN